MAAVAIVIATVIATVIETDIETSVTSNRYRMLKQAMRSIKGNTGISDLKQAIIDY
ncbi:hypothetical protein NX722_26160 [Endozoicomonas gorgoniicola]|uniref:Uncharacterized protein n=1 Tax=Endozoicomonas gorgoniicola TaxID=1234144 RepID=A0ABT3N4B7_9GAMM|nr:hypothetical protein [Endozoicomonas gorgoniicola]MCW7556049.1 hypothetical protein [Endozoicomonas gorgoniicola]